ncbi:galactokinase [soil metagenome]
MTKTPSIDVARPEAERITGLVQRLRQQYTGDPALMRIAKVPLRISPLGAHIDHQLGNVTGMAVDRAILLAFAPTDDGTVRVESRDFTHGTTFHLNAVPSYQKGEWGNYLRGAVLALQQSYRLPHGIIGVMDSDMPIGGLSSSAAVTIAYLLALESANHLSVTPQENIALVTRTEHAYIGLNNGILDQTSILFSERNYLTLIDCETVQIEKAPIHAETQDFAILAVYSGVTQALVGTGYNNRVAECQEAARQLLQQAGQPEQADPRLRKVSSELFREHAHQLPTILQRRAQHFFGEMARVNQGVAAWRAGDITRFGQLMTESGASSIENYECGSPQLITLYHILRTTSGVYGTRFSGAGFRGSCLALIDPAASELIAEAIHRHYPQAHPAEAERYSLHLCQPASKAALLEWRA